MIRRLLHQLVDIGAPSPVDFPLIGQQAFEAGKAIGIAQERLRLLSEGDFTLDEQAACIAVCDQAEAASKDIGT